ncbi:hypothetical protein [Desmospora activa]|uniref:ASCH domain-containing protein n=1 Tax=Desmospora activa DSM 45169 TaxID=1121389 RepID=A0A2T4Z7J4_9BACL|nr:hypothetical protein [Desmospora activa]PTM57849.1 hypothetical protein C8J48_0413 [Desmospora activa DSM 45169]
MDQTDYPEKTCTIERLITRQDDIERVLTGKKRAQRRNGVYAYPGETMILGNHRFIITAVYRQTVGEMNDQDARREGQADKETYLAHIRNIHPGIPLSPKMAMWVHEFEQDPV